MTPRRSGKVCEPGRFCLYWQSVTLSMAVDLGRRRWVVEQTFAWLNQFRRQRCYEKRADIHQAFLSLGCALICWNFLSTAPLMKC